MFHSAADKTGRPSLPAGKMIGTVRGAETDNSFVPLWTDFLSLKCCVTTVPHHILSCLPLVISYVETFEMLYIHANLNVSNVNTWD